MTAPDPGLTDLIAAHSEGDYGRFGCATCVCGWRGDEHPAHVALVVEQHTIGRIASDLGADPQDYEIAWAAKLRWQTRAEKAEAAVDRVRAVEAEYLDPEDTDIECREDVWRFIRDLRAALEGERQ